MDQLSVEIKIDDHWNPVTRIIDFLTIPHQSCFLLYKGALSFISNLVRSRSFPIGPNNSQGLRCPSCKSSSIVIELTFPRLKSIKGYINNYIWSKHMDLYL